MSHLLRIIRGINMSTFVILLTILSLSYACNKAFHDAGGETFTCPDSGSSSSCNQHKCSIICSDDKEVNSIYTFICTRMGIRINTQPSKDKIQYESDCQLIMETMS